MDSYVVTILPGGRITIPAAIRKNLNLHPGDTLEYWRDGREVYLRKAAADDPAAKAADADDPRVAEERGGDTK
jgi:AbrB family looped-hinge helix DNA binding protein